MKVKTIYTSIRMRQMYFGHIMRREPFENMVTTGRINSRRGKGIPKEMLDGLN